MGNRLVVGVGCGGLEWGWDHTVHGPCTHGRYYATSWGGVGMITFDEVQIEFFQVRHCLLEFSCCDNTKRYKKVKRSKLAHRVWIRIGATSKNLSPKMKSPKKTFLVSWMETFGTRFTSGVQPFQWRRSPLETVPEIISEIENSHWKQRKRKRGTVHWRDVTNFDAKSSECPGSHQVGSKSVKLESPFGIWKLSQYPLLSTILFSYGGNGWWFQQPKEQLVGGFNPLEKYESNWIISPSMAENKKCIKMFETNT